VTELRRVPKPLLFVRKHRGQTTERDRRVPAYWHAAGLAKYGHPIRYAYERAEAFGMLPDWRTSIMAGYEFGERCRDEHWSRGIIEVAKRRAEYQEYQRAYYQEIYEKAAAFLKIGGDVLDVGCGDGSGRNFNPQIRHYTGIDVLLTSPSPDLVQGNAEELPFPDERFEGVLCYSVLQHVREPERALDEIRRVLRPGGRFASLTCVDDPNPIFCWQWGRTDVLRLLAARFVVEDHQVLDKRHLLVNARKP
jgi:SAM-dependent methyltransferase